MEFVEKVEVKLICTIRRNYRFVNFEYLDLLTGRKHLKLLFRANHFCSSFFLC